ncbi:unnamed protein product [Didymodactylos carnosus]|uniref:ubiquitinyl hydrolase 1 n=2 Tax=Didymodactylos carnosus TaxID=1234261 RepID=A0A816CVN7_9BILA|nr:unnamed protein product [Didymodactylos carnosus]CAF4521615.1 unnamed protein product [Didymodactylos carnosus]
MDDTGYFSIQVLQRALKIVDIELISYNSQQRIAEQARQTPTNIQGYICNLHQHWLTIRRFGSQYFDLNSMLTVPILISNTYLSLYLAQLQLNGYSIFIVNGVLPVCVADERLSRSPVDPKRYNQLTKRLNNSKVVIQTSSSHKLTSSMFDNDDDNLTRAIEASIQHNNVQDKILQEALEKSFFDSQKGNIQNNELTNQLLLEEAIAASLNNVSLTSQKQQEQLTVDALRSKRLQYYENKE